MMSSVGSGSLTVEVIMAVSVLSQFKLFCDVNFFGYPLIII